MQFRNEVKLLKFSKTRFTMIKEIINKEVKGVLSIPISKYTICVQKEMINNSFFPPTRIDGTHHKATQIKNNK